MEREAARALHRAKAVVVDLDGTLYRGNPLRDAAVVSALMSKGPGRRTISSIRDERKRMRSRARVSGGYAVREVLNALERMSVDRHLFHRLYSLFSTLRTDRHAIELLRDLHRDSKRIIVATLNLLPSSFPFPVHHVVGNTLEGVKYELLHHKYFDVLHILSREGISPKEVVVVEDTPHEILSKFGYVVYSPYSRKAREKISSYRKLLEEYRRLKK